MPHLPGFDHRPMAGGTAVGKLWQTDIIKMIQEIVDKMNKRERQETPRKPKKYRNKWGIIIMGLLNQRGKSQSVVPSIVAEPGLRR